MEEAHDTLSTVPEDGCDAASEHQYGEIPQRIVQHPGSAPEEDQDAGQRVLDGLLRELNSGQGDDTYGCGVEARDQGVHRGGKSIVDALNANSKPVHS